MNQLFSFPRFWLLLRLHAAENGRNYLISSGVLIGLMLLLMTPVLLSQDWRPLLEFLHPTALFVCVHLGGSLIAGMAFLQYSTPVKGIPTLMIPASRLEKFLVAWLFYILLTTIFLVLFWKLHHLFYEIANHKLPAGSPTYRTIPTQPSIFLIYLFFLIQAGVFLGSIYFPKYAYVKSAAALLIVGTTAFVCHYVLANHFTAYPRQLITFPFTSWRVVQNQQYSEIHYPDTARILVWAFLILMIVSLWGIAYLRLKEKEV
jgi:hypothetical protein